MKSLFSCFSKKKSKTNKLSSQSTTTNSIINNRPIEANNCNIQSTIDHDLLLLSAQETSVIEELEEKINSADKEIEKLDVKQDENKYNAQILTRFSDALIRLEKISNLFIGDATFINEITTESHIVLSKLKAKENIEEECLLRFNNALLRIENVVNVLCNKYSGYYLVDVIDLYNLVYVNEFRNYQIESQNINSTFLSQSDLVSNLFRYHNEILSMINNSIFEGLYSIITGFESCVVKLNTICHKNDEYNNEELYKLIADSIVIFGWICVFDRPGTFVQNILDGILINITRILNDNRYIKYAAWLKSWAVFIKKFSLIVIKNFQASLIWGINGPVPMNILKCLIECNYSVIENETFQKKSKGVIVKTTTAENISCDTMTNLMDDLRSGRQKTKLRSVRNEKFNVIESNNVENDLSTNEVVPDISDVKEIPKIPSYNSDTNIWIIDSSTDDPNIEVHSKSKDDSISILNCCNCSIQINGIVQSVTLEHSSSINLVFDEITHYFQISDSSNIECQIFTKINKVDLKSVVKCRLFIPLFSMNLVEINTLVSTDVELYICKFEGIGLELDDYNKYIVEPNGQTKFSDNKLITNLF